MSKGNSKPTSPENLVKPSSAAAVELSESELEKVAGGGKGAKPTEVIVVKLEQPLVSST